MHARSLKVKLFGIFLVAFVCLNAGGAVCVAYCRAAVEAAIVQPDHCPLKKKASHCDPAKDEEAAQTADSLGIDTVDCCTMTFSFIGAPVEKRTFSFQPAAAAAAVIEEPGLLGSFRSARQIPPTVYRGPPLDRRAERIKQRLFRI